MMDQRELDSSIKQLQKTVAANEPPSNALSILERLKKEASPTEEMLRLQKTVAANEPPSNALAILERLKKEASPTEEMLRSTRAGVFVGKLRHNSNKDIARIATELVTKWKKLGDTETRHFNKDGVSIKRTGDTTRDNCLGLLYNGLAYRSTQPPDAVAAAYRHYKGVTDDYKKKIKSLFSNLKVKTNRELGRNVMDGKITADRFVTMTQDELKSAEQRKRENELQEENMKKAQVPMAEKSISDALKCGKCGQKKVSYTQAQTRSADEPMTTFCECTVCGNRWKFS
ncbi:Transcription elongation factor S-II like protein [Verticillium longisporum]|nr:Transcription elongation factor S-II like protein [Verticillium longisporum]